MGMMSFLVLEDMSKGYYKIKLTKGVPSQQMTGTF